MPKFDGWLSASSPLPAAVVTSGTIQCFDQPLQFGAGAPRAAARDDERPRSHREQAYGRVDLIAAGLRLQRRGFETQRLERSGFGEHVERNFQVGRARPSGAQRGEAEAQMIAHILGAVRGARDAEDTRGKRRLVVQLVQHAPLFAERGAHRRGRDHQQRHGIGVGLRDRGEDVGESGAGDHEGRRRAAAGARKAVRRETRALFVAHQHMTQVRGGEPAIQFEIVHAGNTEHRVDAVLGQELNQITADIARHLHLLEIERLFTC